MTQVSCGAPAELDESLFPGPNEVGYADADGTGSTGTPLGGGGAGGQAPSSSAASAGAGTSGSPAPPPANTGANGSGNVAATPPPASGSSPGGTAAGGSAAPGAGGSAQAGSAGGGNNSPVMGGGSPGGCPDDITVLFNRPITAGGCAGGACHVPGATAPDLVSPNVESRLVDVLSQCGGRPYIGADDSFLAEKIGGEQPECGFPMPFFMPDALNATDKQCILDWIDEVSGG